MHSVAVMHFFCSARCLLGRSARHAALCCAVQEAAGLMAECGDPDPQRRPTAQQVVQRLHVMLEARKRLQEEGEAA